MTYREYQDLVVSLKKSLDLLNKYVQKGLNTFLDDGTDEEVYEHMQITDAYNLIEGFSYIGLKSCENKSVKELLEELERIYNENKSIARGGKDI